MLPISNNLLNYLNNETREAGEEITVKITTRSHYELTIYYNEIVQGSIKLSRKSCGDSSFNLGDCYVDSFSFSTSINRMPNISYFDGAIVEVEYAVINGDYLLNEHIKIGTFIINSESSITQKSHTVQVKADSLVSLLDRDIGSVSYTTTLLNIVKWCCTQCDLTFGMSDADFNNLSNNTEFSFKIDSDSGFSTYRDVIMSVAQLIGGFATTNVDGELIFKKYSMSNDNDIINSDTIINGQTTSLYSELNGMYMTIDGTDVYAYGMPGMSYLLQLDYNPLFKYFSSENITTMLANIWDSVKNCHFRDFSCDFNGNPAIEVGDVLDLSSSTIYGFKTIITGFTYKFGGKMHLECIGINKNLKQGSNKTRSSSGGGGGGSSQAAFGVLGNELSDLITVDRTSKIIKKFYFLVSNNVKFFVNISLIVLATEPIDIVLQIKHNSNFLDVEPRYSLKSGYNSISFGRVLSSEESINIISVWIRTKEMGDTCTILPDNAYISILGEGVAETEVTWDSEYELSDSMGALSDTSIPIRSLIDNGAYPSFT